MTTTDLNTDDPSAPDYNHDLDDSRPTPRRNDVAGEPHDEPLYSLDNYEVYVYADDLDAVVPEDVYVYRENDGPSDTPYATQMWTFSGTGGVMVANGYLTHRYGPGNDVPDDPTEVLPCCAMRTPSTGLREGDIPDEVVDIVARVTDAPVALPTKMDEVDGEEDVDPDTGDGGGE